MEDLPIVAFDESGNTRGNLMDRGQPVAVVASVHLTREDAAMCLATLRSVTRQAPTSEIHFRGLKSRTARRGIEALLTSDLLTPRSVRVVLAHKPFAAVCKLVDLTVEPMLYEAGINAYADGFAPAMAQVLHLAAPMLSDAERWRAVLQAFNRACARPAPAEFGAFEEAVATWSLTAGEIGDLAGMVRAATRFLPGALLSHAGEPLNDPLDPALPIFVRLAYAWGDALGNFGVLHDHSTVIQRWVGVLQSLDEFPDPTEEKSNLAALRIPKGALVADADSKDDDRLQVADIIVGAVRTWAVEAASGAQISSESQRFRELTMPWVVDAVWPNAGQAIPTES